MSIKKSSMMLLGAMSLAALLNGCGSSSKEGSSPGGVAKVDEATCRVCHSTSLDPVSATQLLPEFLASAHNTDAAGCQGCHGGGAQHNGVGPIPFSDPLASNRCIVCHGDGAVQVPTFVGTDFKGKCAPCHTVSGSAGLHAAQTTAVTKSNPDSCVSCHNIAIPQHGPNLVGDNNGVRAITTEFAKWSHHVTGVTLNDAHCAACHLEGTVSNGAIVIDRAKHMVDANVHLRNADDDTDFLWDPAKPNHSNMDNFCMSCHDSNGATSTVSAQIQAFINTNGIAAAGKTASASNPFGDTISNRYDKMQRPAVVDAKSQFDPANNSHHAVRGKRYNKRTRIADASDPRAMTAAESAAFAANSSALLQGVRSTIYDAGNFNQLYTPLENFGGEAAPRTGSDTLGDDSTLHCGDCHTVGQWKVGSSTTALGKPTPDAIGAHGSNNEYLLRNSIGTDQRHTQNAYTVASGIVTYTNPNGALLVCYNCHSYSKYGSYFTGTGLNPTSANLQAHAGEYDQAGRCNGIGNTLPFNGYTTGTATDGTQFESRFTGPIATFSKAASYAGEQDPDFGNIFGIQCANCHNSGMGNAYGGIHGSAKNQNTLTVTANATVTGGAYVDGRGNTTKIERFLPGLGNAMHVPGTLGGVVGGITDDKNWEQKHWQQTATTVFNPNRTVSGTLTSAGAGCYTLAGVVEGSAAHNNATAATKQLSGPSVTGAGGAATQVFGTWGACVDHDASQGAADHGFIKRIVRPVTY